MKTQTARPTVLLAALLLCAASTADAALITSAAGLDSPTVVTFAPFAGAENRVNGTGPVQIGTEVGEDIVFTSASAFSFVGSAGYLLGSNGSWSADFGPYTGSNDGSAAMTYRFNDGPVNAVGAFLNYNPVGSFEPVLVEILDAAMTVLESYDLLALAPISTPGGVNDGAFRGISRTSNDISAFRVSGRFIVLDDLTFTRVQVPEPATLALFGLGLAGLGLARRKRAA